MNNLSKIYSRISQLEHDILMVYNEEIGGRGPTGLTKVKAIEVAIDYLNSAKNLLEAIKNKRANE